jgi:2-iminobutanoate/2-iminopropanoate deaminase
VVAGGLIFVSGQASVDGTGKIVSGTFEEEFHRSMENVKRVLAAANSDLAHVVQTRNYVQRSADLQLFNQLYRTYFSPPFPARTTILNCLGEALLFEIEVVAVPRSAS